MVSKTRFPISLLVLLLLYSKCGRSEATTEQPPENVCYWSDNKYGGRCPKTKELVVTFRNGSSSGAVIAQVELPPCHYQSFDIILYDEKKRNENSYTKGRHSWRVYKRIECQNSEECPNNCTKVTNFTFYQVYTGNYSVTVKGCTNDREWDQYKSKPMEIKSDHKHWGTDLNVDEQPTVEGEILNFQLTFTPPTSDIQICLRNERKEDGDLMFFQVLNSMVNVDLHLNVRGEYVSGEHDVIMKMCNVTQEKQEERHIGNIRSVSCAYNTSEIIKSLEIIYSNEDLCDNTSRHCPHEFTQYLCWKTTFLDIQQKEIPLNSTKYYIIYIFIFTTIALVLGATAAVTILTVFRRRQQKTFIPIESPIPTPIISKGIEILLLYPRDCPEFMDLMMSLKDFLKINFDIQVYDCYDMNEEILEGPEEWFQKLMVRSGLRIIVVTTECACLLQEAYLTNIKGMYREPKFLDNFFMYALIHIKQDFSQDVYHKIYTVQISGFSDDVELKFIPTALARYKLPDHLGRLLKNMNVVESNEALIEIESLTSGKAYENVKKCLEQLKLFKIENDRYLYKLLRLNEEKVNGMIHMI